MSMQMLTEYLDGQHVDYQTIPHARTFTASATARAAHIPAREMAKTVMVRLDGRMAMVVIPATARVNLNRLARETGSRSVELCSEGEFAELFPDCEPGAMPPFGNLFSMEVYVADAMALDDQIAFNAGTHTELILMDFDDFDELVHPQITHLTQN